LITPFSNRTLIVLIGGVLISFLLAFLSLSLLNSKFRQRIAEKAIASGCDDYITKPIKKNELLKKIEKLLS
jgi:CheY-like chemotaxis protein